MIVKGTQADEEYRCKHYHKDIDVIAIEFACCHEFYACYQCHEEHAGHPAERWSKQERDRQAIICGHCKHKMPIRTYMETAHCPFCSHLLNEKCANHYPLYFEM